MSRHAYSGFMFLALAVFLVVRALMPPQALQREPWRKQLGLALGAFLGGAFGAKLPFVFDSAQGPLLAWISDGKTITTGLMGAYLGVECAKWLLDVRVKTGDSFALPLACALAVGRWGCFFHGCCYGTETDLPWGREFLDDGVCRHPTQAYESVFHLTMAVVLWFCLRHGWFRGNQLKVYLIAYGVYRFASETIRPEPEVFAGLTFYQWASVVMIAGLSAQWVFDRRGPLTPQPPLPPGGEGEEDPLTPSPTQGRGGAGNHSPKRQRGFSGSPLSPLWERGAGGVRG